MIEDTLLHVETVGISKERSLVVKALITELDYNFLSTVWWIRQAEKIDLNFQNDIVVISLMNSNSHVCLIRPMVLFIHLAHHKQERVL